MTCIGIALPTFEAVACFVLGVQCSPEPWQIVCYCHAPLAFVMNMSRGLLAGQPNADTSVGLLAGWATSTGCGIPGEPS